ncbi:hypothetical protein J4N45_11025 [Vibrio sp. SCSIO 43140]|uniref:hypothetical protein n=1 Tax=Vibrio sp. SCSIO 43140 TaxID=2819100 RepID=UPI0020757A15|nr:hypothetical protein [Vibrio sp. SCSIO 43140]USD59063.1 hypothetical protein J4N45_11025 [Vibrio sp. SCSIO 43140]
MSYFMVISLFIAISRYVIESNRYSRFFLYSVGMVGTPVHELGHYIVCKLVGFRVEKVVLFRMPSLNDSSLGSVGFVAPEGISGDIRKTLVSIGPLFSGAAVLYLLSPYVVPYLFNAFGSIDFFQFYEYAGITQWVCLWVMSSVALHMLPSGQDIKTGVKGLFWVICVLYVLAMTGINAFPEVMNTVNHYLYQLGQLMRIGLTLSIPITSVAAILVFFSIAKMIVYKVVHLTKKGEEQ